MPKTVQQIVKCCTTNSKPVVQQPKTVQQIVQQIWKLSNKLSTTVQQMATVQQMGKTVQQIWKTVQQTPSVGQILSKMLYNKPDCWRSVVQQALERRETVQQISECLMSRPQGSGKGGGAPYRWNVWGVPPTYRQRGWLQNEGGQSRSTGDRSRAPPLPSGGAEPLIPPLSCNWWSWLIGAVTILIFLASRVLLGDAKAVLLNNWPPL